MAGPVAVLIVVLAGLGVAGGVGAALVGVNDPDSSVQLEQRTEPEVIDYGTR
ncbi:hypothetical protein [Umezawaea beigongshangensis]|uniref:hypothetical protein n=1 Tax=Umezawaea beigongshangensis TaxID=2780383 RepID=UPI0018F2252E|nr:hypothetical protein [Umezawaea beigongshangensis]